MGIDGDEQEQQNRELRGDQREAGDEYTGVKAENVFHAQYDGEWNRQRADTDVCSRQADNQKVGLRPQLLMQVDRGTNQQVQSDRAQGQYDLQEDEGDVVVHILRNGGADVSFTTYISVDL